MVGSIQGNADSLEGEWLIGWAIDTAGSGNCTITVESETGDLVALGKADHARPDLASLGFGRTDFAFRLRLPPGALSNERLKVLADGTELWGSPLHLGPGRFDGYLAVREGKATGWVKERVDAANPPTVTLADDFGHTQGPVATRMVDNPDSRHFSVGHFQCDLDQSFFGREDARLRLCVGEVAVSEARADLRLLGCVEVFTRATCSGWLYAPQAPGRIFTVGLFADRECLAQAKGDIARIDVVAGEPAAVAGGFTIDLAACRDRLKEQAVLDLRLIGSDHALFDDKLVVGQWRSEDPAAPPAEIQAAASSEVFEDARDEGQSDYAIVTEHFDFDFYNEHDPALKRAGVDPVKHFLEHGWRERRDPSPDFSTKYYLDSNKDIRAADINPFIHYLRYGSREGRHGLPFRLRKLRQVHRPFVSVIVPNFNHARFLRKRIDCILEQDYDNFELILLDDLSSDESVSVLKDYESRYPEKITLILNEVNSGNTFIQWKKGIQAAKGEVIWICESDDFCEPDFLGRCIRPLADPSVMIAFGRVQFSDAQGRLQDGLDNYRENAESGIWASEIIRPASEWFRGAFAISNLIPNVGGCVFRNQPIADAIWRDLLTYKIVGDWYLYCVLASGGRIAFVPDAVAYFRQHGRNTSVAGFQKRHFYVEHERIFTELRRRWGTTDDVAANFYKGIYRQFVYAKAEKELGKLSSIYSNDAIMKTEKTVKHILIVSLGFHLGGGELFPIYLANALVQEGHTVSMMCTDTVNEIASIRRMLDSRVAVYEAQLISEMGVDRFLDTAGIDLIHSHTIAAEFFFLRNRPKGLDIPYLVTLHGSYEVTTVSEEFLVRLLRGVSHWVYLSQKNLRHLRRIPIAQDRLSRIANGMPLDTRDFVATRAQLEIGPDDLVFTIASRAIKEKGWREAIEAMRIAQQKTSVALHVLLCGSGPDEAGFKDDYEGARGVHFMGFQERISGAYRMSDVALLPTRFLGESFPLTLIQGIQEGKPVIATDIGEIRSMILRGELCCGIPLAYDEDDEAFIETLARAMLRMTDPTFRLACAEDAAKMARTYDMSAVVSRYTSLYDIELERIKEL